MNGHVFPIFLHFLNILFFDFFIKRCLFFFFFLMQVLILHLKRFSQGKYRRKKLECTVDFPLEGLDMTPYFVVSSPHRTGNNL
jgi:hypothetical protein